MTFTLQRWSEEHPHAFADMQRDGEVMADLVASSAKMLAPPKYFRRNHLLLCGRPSPAVSAGLRGTVPESSRIGAGRSRRPSRRTVEDTATRR
jgi:hypothetical protein